MERDRPTHFFLWRKYSVAYLLPKRWWDDDGNEHFLISSYRPTLVYDDRNSLVLSRLHTIHVVGKYGQ
jgi:hypothetical protein